MITVRAHAKINLHLRVLGIRPDDGYHDLRTVFQSLALHDTLRLRARPGPFALESDDARLPLDEQNLVWRAATLLWSHLGRAGAPSDLVVQIDKRIPMKGGLGGGSADAAAALIGLARVWDTDVPPEELRALGRRLGADVGFFFTGGAALGEGRGDQLYLLPDLPPLGVLLVVPGFDVSTAEAYRWVDEARGWGRGQVGPPDLLASLDSHAQKVPHCPWPAPLDEVVNDFEPVVAARHPQVDTIVRALGASGAAAAAMTGSGSTVFGLFEREDAIAAAAEAMTSFGRVLTTSTLGRADYLELSAPRESPDRQG
jgi:4-diphosphocytidyl-2-C-methyl-D-erythritol kinase